VIGPAEIEDILSDLSEALAHTAGAPLERMPVWPVPAGTVAGANARNKTRSPAPPRSRNIPWPDERVPGPVSET
jgi:hypothetical protein